MFDMDNNLDSQTMDSQMQEKYDSIMLERAKKKQKVLFINGILVGFLVAMIVCSCGYLILQKSNRAKLANETPSVASTKESVITRDVENKIGLLEDSIKQYYLEDVNNEDLEVGIYKGMVNAIGDPYSTYYTVDEMKKLKESTEGIYYGIGAYVGYDQATEHCKFTGIIPNTPAEEVGLKAEDVIVEVDGQDTTGMTTTDVVALIKGEENTDVVLKIFRTGETDYLTITVTRRKVEAPTVEYEMLDDKIAYITISQFEDVTSGQFIDCLEQAEKEGMKGLIIDLRSNPGGTLSSVVEIAQNLLPEGLIVYTEDKYGERNEYRSSGKRQIEVPLVVLVNENSASASEILAGAIKDYKIGTLVGTTTFGKGIVQKVFGITDGSAVKLTTSHYYTPNGNDIHKVGIKPDVEVELDVEAYLDDESDNQKDKAIEIMKSKLK